MAGKGLLRSVCLSILPAVVCAFSVSGFGAVINVSTVAELNTAVATAGSGDQIVVANGTYNLTQELKLATSNVTLRSASGNADDVVLLGAGMNNEVTLDEAVMVKAGGVRIEGVTIRSFYRNGIHIRGDLGADGTQIIGVKTLNIGRWHVRSSDGPSEDVLIQNVTMDQTNARQARDADTDLIGGIYAVQTSDWRIKTTTIRNIRGATGNSTGAISLSGSTGSIIERNELFNNGKGLSLDNGSGDIVRNNFITRSSATGADNNGIYLANNQDVLVAYNTVYGGDATYARAIVATDVAKKKGAKAASSSVDLQYNLVRGGLTNDIDGNLIQVGNLIDNVGGTVVPGWFVDPAIGDLHLRALALGAIDQGTAVPEVVNDLDNQTRPDGLAPDLGADESPYVVPEPATALVVVFGALGIVLRKWRR